MTCPFCDPEPCDCEDGGLPFDSFGEEWPLWVPRQMVDVELPRTG